MLTEGTDVPNVNTVFLTRQTTSKILLTQMVGRALRGTKFGGTDEANIVSFIDNWQQLINWAEFELEDGGINYSNVEVGEPLPIQLISIDLVRRLVRQMDSGININDVPFLTLMPISWYRVELETLTGENENIEIVQRLVMVFENEKESYENYIECFKYCKESELETFVEPTISFDKQHQQRVESLQKGIFSNLGQHIGGDLLTNLFYITCHMAQNDRESPDWFDFKERQEHNLDNVAQRFIDSRLSRSEEDNKLTEEYNRSDRYWKIIYHSYGLFKSQYNACVERLLAIKRQCGKPKSNGSTFTSKSTPPLEPSEQVKTEIKKRDKSRCLCCKEAKKHLLVIDHIKPKYHGGDHSQDNLQTLCSTCNTMKGTETIDFGIHKTPLNAPPSKLPKLELPNSHYINGIVQWQQFFRRSVNLFYGCDAVKSVEVGQRNYSYQWQIYLHAGNDPRWLVSHLQSLFSEIRQAHKKAGFSSPESIIINAPGFDVVAPLKV